MRRNASCFMNASRFILGWLLMATGTMAGCATTASRDTGVKLPISRVILYQNGVGYFERTGTVDGKSLTMSVRPDQINDVLKSLAVLKKGSGQVSAISFPVERSTDKLAQEIPHQVRRAHGIIGLLRVMRGTMVEVETAERDVKGRVVGVEGQGKQAKATLMTSKRRLVTLRASAIRRLRILDSALAQGLSRSLDLAREEGRWKPVSLTVRFSDEGPHQLLVSYIQEVPVWRSAYRAWVESDRPVQLSGWAVVDNVSGEDWNNVKLSMVVGSPLSFRYELHRPHHVYRPSLNSRLPGRATAPPAPTVGYAKKSSRARRPARPHRGFEGLSKGGGRGRGPRAEVMEDEAEPSPAADSRPSPSMFSDNDRRAAMASGAAALVRGRKVGALYSYDSLSPVTVPDGKAALVPIVNRPLKGEDVFFFRERHRPFRAVRLTNESAGSGGEKGATLESGPITLYVDGTFAGEGFLGRLTAGQTTFIPYAVDNSLEVRTTSKTEYNEVQLVKVVNGRIHVSAKQTRVTTLKVRSRRDKPSVAFVRVYRRGGWKIQSQPKGSVAAGHEHYVRVEVPANGTGSSAFVEETPVHQSYTNLSGLALTAFKLYLKGVTATDAVRGPIEALLQANAELSKLNSTRYDLYRKRGILSREASRLQNNLKALPKGKVAQKLRAKLVKQLASNNDQLAQVAKSLVELDVKQRQLRDKMRDLMTKISIKP